MKTVVLWDIDGTLLKATEVFQGMTCKSFSQITYVDNVEYFKTAGMVDHEILLRLFKENHVEPNPETFALIKKLFLELIEQRIAQGNHCEAMGGVRAVLDELASNPEVSQGLLTGNYEERAWVALESAGLKNYFSFGAFGDNALNREEVARKAMANAPAHDRVVVIGDTVNDTRCAKAIGARSVIVLSGAFTRKEIEAEEPDAILEDFEDTKVAVKAILD